MIRIPKPISATSNIGRRQASLKAAPPDIRHLRHKLANQLTVINLCCGKIHARLALAEDGANAAELNQIEKSVEECVRISRQVEQLNQPCVSARCARQKRSDMTSTTNGNVYPLFDILEQRRAQD